MFCNPLSSVYVFILIASNLASAWSNEIEFSTGSPKNPRFPLNPATFVLNVGTIQDDILPEISPNWVNSPRSFIRPQLFHDLILFSSRGSKIVTGGSGVQLELIESDEGQEEFFGFKAVLFSFILGNINSKTVKLPA